MVYWNSRPQQPRCLCVSREQPITRRSTTSGGCLLTWSEVKFMEGDKYKNVSSWMNHRISSRKSNTNCVICYPSLIGISPEFRQWWEIVKMITVLWTERHFRCMNCLMYKQILHNYSNNMCANFLEQYLYM